MRDMAHGKHRKNEKNYRPAAYLTTGALALGGIALGTGTANATAGPEQLAQWAKAGCPELSGSALDTAVRIAGAESDGNPSAHNTNGEDSRGLWQINVNAHGSPWGDLFDPVTNARAMCDVSNGGTNWSPWTTYVNGAYLGEQGWASPVEPVPGDSHPSAQEPPAESPAEPQGGTWTVEPGDTLYGITRALTGDCSLDNWRPLYEANRETIGSNPDLIFPGQVLTLPWVDAAHDDTNGPADEPEQPVEQPPAAPVAGGYSAPLDGIGPSDNGYGNQPPGVDYALGYHTGTDFTAPEGTPVKAISDGVVVSPDTSPSYGNNVQIQHDDGTYSLYAHLSAVHVDTGQRVSAGDVIGAVGDSGKTTGAHLHLEVRVTPSFGEGNFIDPVIYLAGKGINF